MRATEQRDGFTFIAANANFIHHSRLNHRSVLSRFYFASDEPNAALKTQNFEYNSNVGAHGGWRLSGDPNAVAVEPLMCE